MGTFGGRAAILIVAGVCMTAGYIGETRLNALCNYGGDCVDEPQPNCLGQPCGMDTHYYAYYDYSCSYSAVCCQGPVYCFDQYPGGPCSMCGSTDDSFCWSSAGCPSITYP